MLRVPVTSFLNWDTVLVITVFLCAFVIPVFPPSWGALPFRIGFSLIFISGVLTMEKLSNYILLLALGAFIMEWVSGLLDLDILTLISKLMNILFFLIVIISLIKEMATAKVVTARVLMSAISGYLLLGIIFSVAIVAIIQRDPGAFNFSGEVNNNIGPTAQLSKSLYFGFVTLATLGYGDLLPLKPYTRSLATLICISGQLYIATIIGILIGKFASGNNSKSK